MSIAEEKYIGRILAKYIKVKLNKVVTIKVRLDNRHQYEGEGSTVLTTK